MNTIKIEINIQHGNIARVRVQEEPLREEQEAERIRIPEQVPVREEEEAERIRIPCNLCNKTYSEHSNVYKHMRTAHGLEAERIPIVCQLCKKTFKYRFSFEYHTRTKHAHQQ